MAMELIEGRDLRTAMAQAVARDLQLPIPVAAYIIARGRGGASTTRTARPMATAAARHRALRRVAVERDAVERGLREDPRLRDRARVVRDRRSSGGGCAASRATWRPSRRSASTPTAAADVFALGIIAWELFTGLPLYRGHDLKSILEAVRRTTAAAHRSDEPAGAARDRRRGRGRAVIASRRSAGPRPTSCRRVRGRRWRRCARTRGWLADLDARPSGRELSWQPDPVVGEPAEAATPEPPLRPSTRSLTASISAVSPPPRCGFRRGHAGVLAADAVSDRAHDRSGRGEVRGADGDLAELQVRRSRSDRRASAAPRFGGRARARPRASTSQQWGPEGTAAGVGEARRCDAWRQRWSGPDSRRSAGDDVFGALQEPPTRQSYGKLEMMPGVAPSALRFDDEATQHGFAAPIGEATSFDDLQVELEAARRRRAGSTSRSTTTCGRARRRSSRPERRRTVVVAAALDGGERESCGRSRRASASSRISAAVSCSSSTDDALIVAFGLEVAGEDDVAIAMGWALDAAAMARDAAGDGASARVGRDCGSARAPASRHRRERRASCRRRRSTRRARSRSEAAPDRPLFVGAAGRMTSGLYALRELPAPRRIARRSSVIEVVGPRGFDERDRARLERRGKFVGRTAQLAELDAWLARAQSPPIAGSSRSSPAPPAPARAGSSPS